MTADAGEHHRKLEHALREGYRAQADAALRDGLAEDILREIRQQTSRSGGPSGAVWVDDLVWRTATMTVAVVAVMAVFAVGVVRTTTGEPMAITVEGLASVPLLGDE